MSKRRWARRIARILGAFTLAALILAVAGGWRAFGHRPVGERRARVERSPQFRDGKFRNPQPLVNYFGMMMKRMLHASDEGAPRGPLPIVHGGVSDPPASGLGVTWLGHSTTLVEIDGHRLLTDPLFSERASPLPGLGPSRFYPPPIPLDALPALDAVVISHDHYDHLDYGTIAALKDRVPRFVVPLGVGAHLEYWGVPPEKIIELDWWQRAKIGGLEIVCTPARHASGRTPLDQDSKLWAGYAFLGEKHRVYFSGDTGLFPAMREIGEKLGPFDLTMIEIGQYDPAWPDWHIGPEQAVRAHEWVRGRVMLPIHWGLLRLAYHSWTEPIERVSVAAKAAGAILMTPRPGQRAEPSAPPPSSIEKWWPNVPWKTANQDPIVSTQVN